MYGSGFPIDFTGSLPAAVVTAATIAPAPGQISTGIGYVASLFAARYTAPFLMARLAVFSFS